MLRWLTPEGLDLAELLLSYDPLRRVSAEHALQAPYFLQEDPPPCKPERYVRVPSIKCLLLSLM